jgi:hypothetical protein
MTEEQLAEFIGVTPADLLKPKMVAHLATHRALYERMAQVCVEAELYAAGLGPRPVGALLDFARPLADEG